MKSNFIKYITLSAVINLLPGCSRVFDWGKDHFYQGELVETETALVRDYIRSKIVYDQLETRARFDAIWLSDTVRTAYSKAYALRHHKSESQKNMFLRRQLEENHHFVMFYVLSLNDVLLGAKSSEWSVILKVDNTIYEPDEIKKIDLPPEYKMFFDKKYSKFKKAYQVTFNARNINDRPRIAQETKSIVLHFRTHDKEATLEWHNIK